MQGKLLSKHYNRLMFSKFSDISGPLRRSGLAFMMNMVAVSILNILRVPHSLQDQGCNHGCFNEFLQELTINANAFSNLTISSFGKWNFHCSQISNNLNRSFLLSPSNHLIQKHPIYDEIVIEQPPIGHALTTHGSLAIQSNHFQDSMSQSDHEF